MAALFCSEGNQHVKRPSSRVTQPPGGASSIVFGDNSAPEPVKRRQQPQPVPEKPKEVLVNTTNQYAQQQQQHHHQVEAAGAQRAGYDTLFCNEGSQLRNRPAKKILQPPGGSSSIFN